jgi:hypothetical protein
MVQAARYSISSRYAGKLEARLLAPLAVTLAAFLVIKWVHGQDDNHPILFMMLGMVSALIYKLRHGTPGMKTADSEWRPVRTDWARLVPAARSPTHGVAPRQVAD